ncbi:MAG TPA: response regulator transcription factor [Rhodococcus sp. (in: high G+C Gram-positive bacteria)]|nr:response regulator transcription factor [Rhodococcus sp. (in: high G+C Gram-positive bacteria)]
MMIRVVVADDQALVRDGIAAVLNTQSDIDVVGSAGDGAEAVELVAALDPDVVVLDIRMPRLDGIGAAEAVLTRPDNRTRVMMLTTFDLDDYVYDALSLGASGFLLKQSSASDFITGVRTVAAGESMLAPSVTTRLIAEFARRKGTAVVESGRASALTPREREVLQVMARGMSNPEIASELSVAEETVKTHIGRILGKLGLRDRTQAVVFYFEHVQGRA